MKEIIKITAEINNKIINKTKFALEKINKIDNLVRLIKKKREKTKITKI